MLLRVGLDQMSVHGVSGVTLGQLASASGISKSGLFAHFRSKEQLQISLLDEMAKTAERIVVEPAMRAEKGLPRLRKLVNLWLGWSRRAGLQGGCPVAAAAFELDDLDTEIGTHVRAVEERWQALLRQLADEAVAEGHLSPGTDIDQLVWELCGIYLAHHVASRFRRSTDADLRARVAITALLKRAGADDAAAWEATD